MGSQIKKVYIDWSITNPFMIFITRSNGKEIQSGSRKKKTALIEETNPHRKDLREDWY